MAYPKLSMTNYKGIGTYKDNVKGIVFVGSFRINGKLHKKIVGYSNDQFKTTAKIAFINKEALISQYKDNYFQEVKKLYTFEKLFNEYMESVDQVLSQNSLKIKSYNFKRHIKQYIGHIYIDKITTVEIQKIINKLLKDGYAPQTAKNIKNIIQVALNYAKTMRYIDNNPAELVQIPKFDNTVEYTLSGDEAKRLFSTILNFNELIYRGIFTFLLHGHRKSEILNLSWDNIDFKNRVYEIPAKFNKAKKNKKHPVTDILYILLVNMDDKKGYVFKSPNTGTKFSDIRRAWSRIKKEAEIDKDFRIHDIRHLIGNTTINELGLSSNVAAAILGHSTTKMVDERYSDVRIDTISKGLDMMFEYLKQ